MKRRKNLVYKCDYCDYLRCVKTLDECGCGYRPKVEVAKNIRNATVCVNPESPHYGECRRTNVNACAAYADWCWRFDDGDVNSARAEQERLVTRYRRERLGLNNPYEGNGGAGGSPW